MNWNAIWTDIRQPLERARQSYVGTVLWRALNDYRRDAGSVYAAAITYYVLLSLFPLLIFLVSVFGLLIGDPALQERVVDEIVRQLPPGLDLEEQVEGVVSGVANTRFNIVGLLGLGGAIWTASGMFGALRRALNSAFDVPMARSFIHGRLLDIVSVLAVIILVIISMALTATLTIVRVYADQYFTGTLITLGWTIVYLLVPLAFSFSVFLVIFRLIPNHTLAVGDLWPGALIAAIGFELAKAAFSFYLANFGRYEAIYGALGGIVAFLFFVFMAANIMILAAEINAELARDRTRGKGKGTSG